MTHVRSTVATAVVPLSFVFPDDGFKWKNIAIMESQIVGGRSDTWCIEYWIL